MDNVHFHLNEPLRRAKSIPAVPSPTARGSKVRGREDVLAAVGSSELGFWTYSTERRRLCGVRGENPAKYFVSGASLFRQGPWLSSDSRLPHSLPTEAGCIVLRGKSTLALVFLNFTAQAGQTDLQSSRWIVLTYVVTCFTSFGRSR